MILKFVLPWFPILLATALGSRLLGRARGYALGVLCALFWIVVVQASEGWAVWTHFGSAATLLAGAAAIVAIGGWGGDALSADSSNGSLPPADSSGTEKQGAAPRLALLTESMERFDDWLEEHRQDRNPWPRFDEFLRSMLYQTCQASHVLPLRLIPESDQLVPLREIDASESARPVSASCGVVGEVLRSGRPFVLGERDPGASAPTVEGVAGNIVWCIPMMQASRRLGVILVRRMGIDPRQNRDWLHVAAAVSNRFWCELWEASQSRRLSQDDPASGLFTREAFVKIAGAALQDCHRQSEPAALVVVALERLRELNDAGRWELADELLRAVGKELTAKLRADDLGGKFDGSRFLLLLRRVDRDLATLIITQLMARLNAVCGDASRWGLSIGVRCGFVCSDANPGDLRILISKALAQWRRARGEDQFIVNEKVAPRAKEEAPA